MPYPARVRRTVTVPFVALPLAALVVAAALVATAVITAAAVRPGGSRGVDSLVAGGAPLGSPSSQPGGQPSSPVPSASPSPSVNPLQDPCLIGTWTETSHEQDGKISGDTVRYSGHGAVQRFRVDGTAVLDFGGGVTYTATHKGDKWEDVDVGTVTFHWQTSGGSILYSNAQGNGTQTLKENGRVSNTAPLTGGLSSERYTCTGDDLRQFSERYTIELHRTSTSG